METKNSWEIIIDFQPWNVALGNYEIVNMHEILKKQSENVQLYKRLGVG